MKLHILILLVSVLGLSSIGRAQSQAAPQDQSKEDKKNKWFFVGFYEEKGVRVVNALNPTRVTRDGDLVQFWVREVPIPLTKEFLVSYLSQPERITSPSGKQPETFDYRLIQYMGNCKSNTLAGIKATDYWKDETEDSFDINAEPRDPPADSIGERLLVRACSAINQ